jgi:hypothetical protein
VENLKNKNIFRVLCNKDIENIGLSLGNYTNDVEFKYMYKYNLFDIFTKSTILEIYIDLIIKRINKLKLEEIKELQLDHDILLNIVSLSIIKKDDPNLQTKLGELVVTILKGYKPKWIFTDDKHLSGPFYPTSVSINTWYGNSYKENDQDLV